MSSMHEERRRNTITYMPLRTVGRRVLSARAMTCVSSQQRVSTNGPRLYRAITGALPRRIREDCHQGQAEAAKIGSCWLLTGTQQLNTRLGREPCAVWWLTRSHEDGEGEAASPASQSSGCREGTTKSRDKLRNSSSNIIASQYALATLLGSGLSLVYKTIQP